MRALEIIRQKIAGRMEPIHKSRWNALWLAVAALLSGGKLWPAALGRQRPGTTSDKHGIKSIDRLLGNEHLYQELKQIYAAIVRLVLRALRTPIILIDITEIRPGLCALTASLAHDGRGLPIYAVVERKGKMARPAFKRKFLHALRDILPANITPILVTDAGFQSPWFDAVQAMGWDYVARVRHRTKFRDNDSWASITDLYERATKWARDLGALEFPRCKPKARRLVLSQERKSKGRCRLNQKGRPGRTANDRRCQKSAREPWLLATSLTCSPDQVVNIYSFRMQIEQNYRDAKGGSWGWELEQYRSKRCCRFEILLLIAALGVLVQHSVGCAGELKKLHRLFQANTIRDRRVISLFALGQFLLQSKHAHRLDTSDISRGFVALCLNIRTLE